MSLRKLVLIWSAVMLAVGVLAVLPPEAGARERTGVATKRLPIWEERDTDSRVLFTAPPGATITVTDRARKGFYPVRLAGIEGWTLTGYVAISVDDDLPRTTRRSARDSLRGFATEDLNLRSGPSTSHSVRDIIPSGNSLELTGDRREGFVAVQYGPWTGWVAEEYVETAQPAAPAREVIADPRRMSQTDIVRYIYAAADYYGQPREDMLRVAMCESDLVPTAVNAEGGSYGIFQFKTGTWLSTPYAEYDIFDPRASAYAAAWMWSVGRRNEWVCQ